LISYQVDNSSFPMTAWSIDKIKDELTRGGLGSIPSDPDRNTSFVWINNAGGNLTWTPWQYMYTPIKKNGFVGGWFVLMARTETENGSNFIFCGTGTSTPSTPITSNTDFDDIFLCSTIVSTGTCLQANSWSSACGYQKWEWQMRYIYRY
jgi:hypothetical protein